jgi:hypothetical protein
MVDKVIEEKTAQCITNHVTKDEFWVDLKIITQDTEVSINDIKKLIAESGIFVQNKNGQLTTRNIYRKNETFVNKLLNSFKNKID